MDRRQKKLEKKKKDRALKKKAQSVARSGAEERLMRLAARSPFGPCAVSEGWDDLEAPQLVSVLITRKLPDGSLIPSVVLVDRTCLGVKDSFTLQGMTELEFDELRTKVGAPHGGMVDCEPLVAHAAA